MDQVCSVQAKKLAEARFEQLEDDIWKDFVVRGVKVVRFRNSHASAVSIINDVIQAGGERSALWRIPISVRDAAAPRLYQELLERINNSRQEIESLCVDRIHLLSHPDPYLESFVVPRLQEVKQSLAKFRGQLVAFGDPPTGFEGIPQQVVYQGPLDEVNEAKAYIQAIQEELDNILHKRADISRKSALEVQLKVARDDLAASALVLINHGDPPEGYERVIFDYRDLSVGGCIAQAKHQAFGLFQRAQ